MITPLRADSFRATYPLSFQLTDGEGKAALYIVSEAKIDQQQLILEIRNTSGVPIYFASLQAEGTPTAAACHFELRFRPGTLSETTLGVGSAETPASTAQLATTRAARKTPPAGGAWQVSSPAQIQQLGSEWVSYYIGRMGKGAPWMMAPDATIRLTLQGISAGAAAGTRETRAALLPGNEKLYFAEPSADSRNYLTQAREQTLRVINHLGEPNIPLHTGFIGPYTILNDGTPHDHQLELRLTNTSAKKPIRFNKQSKIHLSFDTSPTPDQAGAIGTRENAEAIRFFLGMKRSRFGEMDEAARAAQPQIQKDPSSEMGQTSFKTISYYDLARVYEREVLIPPKGSLILLIDFSLFETIHPAGLTFLHLHYENIPGYWDGQLSVPIEISPLWIEKTNLRAPGEVRIDSGALSLSIVGPGLAIRNDRLELSGAGSPSLRLAADGTNPGLYAANGLLLSGGDGAIGIASDLVLDAGKKVSFSNGALIQSDDSLSLSIELEENTEETFLRLDFDKLEIKIKGQSFLELGNLPEIGNHIKIHKNLSVSDSIFLKKLYADEIIASGDMTIENSVVRNKLVIGEVPLSNPGLKEEDFHPEDIHIASHIEIASRYIWLKTKKVGKLGNLNVLLEDDKSVILTVDDFIKLKKIIS